MSVTLNVRVNVRVRANVRVRVKVNVSDKVRKYRRTMSCLVLSGRV